MVRERSAKPLCVGSIPTRASNFARLFSFSSPIPSKGYLICAEIFRFQNRIELPSPRDISLKLLLAGAYPGVVMLLGDPHALMSEQNGYPLDWYAGK